jgi:Cdc6-like AAA superfamily ATPase
VAARHRSGVWAVGYNGTILETENGGQDWQVQESGSRAWLMAVQFVDTQHGRVVGNNGTILTTDNGGQDWQVQQSGSPASLMAVQFVDTQRGWAVGENGTILVTDNGGQVWRGQESGSREWLLAVQFVDAQRGWAVGDNGTILVTDNGGQVWRGQQSGSRERLRAVQFVDALRGWAVGSKGTILMTENGGQNWSPPLYKKGLAPWYYLSWLVIAGFLVPVLRRPKPQIVQAKSIANVAISDRPLRSGDPDPLHFQAIAQGLSRFLRNKNSEPPVTIAVTGKWGSGKSSLMNLLSDDLKRFGTKAVWFNAWHHQRQSQVLAALLENIRKQAIPSWLIPAGWSFRVRLLWQRGWQQKSLMFFVLAMLSATVAYLSTGDNFNKARLEFRKVVSSQSVELTRTSLDKIKQNFEVKGKPQDWVILAPLLQANEGKVYASKKSMYVSLVTQASDKQKKPLDNNKYEILLHAQQAGIIAKLLRGQKDIGHDLGSILGGVLGPLFTLLLVFGTIWKNVGAFGLNPSVLLKSINGKSNAKQLRDQSSFRHQFAKEFEDVTRALKPYQMVIIIDDLDRCNPDAVLEVLEAVNFLVSSGECYVVLGMDMDMVRSCVGLGYERLAEELVYEMNHETDDPKQKAKENRRDFARHYLEKLVNIEVPIPAPDSEQSRELLTPAQAVESTPPSLRQRVGAFVPGFICGLVPVAFMLVAVFFGLMINYYVIGTAKPVDPFIQQSIVVAETNNTQLADSSEKPVSEKPGGASDNKPDEGNGKAGFTPGNSADYGWHHGYPVFMVLLLAALWMGIRRPDIVVTDSRDFKQALNIWYKVIAHYSKTPRSMKRFINRVRYLAMFQSDGSVADALRHRVDKLWKRIWDLHLAEQTRHVYRIPEPILVALGAIYLGNPKFFTGDVEELHNKLKALPNILPADATNELRILYSTTVTQHSKLYPWPPTVDQIREFLERCEG